MADSAAAESSPSTWPERSKRHTSRRPSRLSNGHDVRPEDAANGCPTAVASDARVEVAVGSKRERPNEVAVDDRSAATAESDRHVADEPREGQMSPAQPCHSHIASLCTALHLKHSLTAVAPV